MMSSAAASRLTPTALETIGERREQIGDRKACDERQQDLAEQPQGQHDHDERAQPENDLALDGISATWWQTRGADAMLRAGSWFGDGGIHVAHPLSHVGSHR